MKTTTLDKLVENCPANYGGEAGSRDSDALVAKVSNIAGSGEFHREFETRSFTDRELIKLTARPGDLFVVKSSGSKKKILSGKTAIIAKNTPTPLIASNFLLLLRPNSELVEPRYLWRVLNSTRSKAFIKTVVGTFTYPNLKWSTYCKHPIPLPPLDEQRRIAGILDAADALRAKRRESLAQLETLLQSTFLDMFGDPVTNPKGWAVEVFDSWLDKIDSGWSPNCLDRKALDDEWGVLKLGAVTWCEFDETNHKALPPDLKARPGIEVHPGDLLFTRKNTHELVAAAAYVHSIRPKLMLPDLIFRLILKPQVDIDPTFLWQLLIEPHQRQTIQKLAGGAAGSMPNISKAKLKTVRLIKPPLDLQHRFATIVDSVEQQKTHQRAHLAELDTLFAALQQRAFNGEL